jgi:hypothetical protein
MPQRLPTSTLALLLAALVPAAAGARDTIKHVDLEADEVTTLKGRISGYDSADFVIVLKARQALTAHLRSNSRFAYFNVLLPGSQTAVFNGAMEGGTARVIARSGGPYIVRVYLMRNAARRENSASFALNLRVTMPGDR